MGKGLFCVLMMTVLLTGCGGTDGRNDAEETALQLRGKYLEMTGCSGVVQLTADYGLRVYRYELDFTQGEEETVMVLTAPEEVSGITARLTAQSDTVLEYDDVVLETGALHEEGLTPIGAIPALLSALREGYLDTCSLEEWESGAVLRMLIREPENPLGTGTEILLWLEADSGKLLRAELSQDGVCAIQCEFSDWNMILGEST